MGAMSVNSRHGISIAGRCHCNGLVSGKLTSRLSRRGFLWVGVTSAAAALSLAHLECASAQTALSPDAALQRLIEGNKRFVDQRLTSFDEDLAILKQNTVVKQEPFAAVLACADSRVPVELVFDQSIGHLFVARVAGNLATSEIIASLEYGAAVLGTKAIIVLGHSNCGAVKAAIDGKAVPGQISQLYAPIRPAIEAAGTDVDSAVKANARIQAALLRQSSPVLAEHIKQNQLKIVSAYYDLTNGNVSLLD